MNPLANSPNNKQKLLCKVSQYFLTYLQGDVLSDIFGFLFSSSPCKEQSGLLPRALPEGGVDDNGSSKL